MASNTNAPFATTKTVTNGRTSSGTTFRKMRDKDSSRRQVDGEKLKLVDHMDLSHHVMSRRMSQSFTSGPIRENVFSNPVEIAKEDSASNVFEHSSFRKTQKSDETKTFIYDVLKANFLFASLSSAEIRLFEEAMTSEKVKVNESIIIQGDEGDYFYILEKGKVDFLVNGNKVSDGEAGKSFGELALLHNCPRTATAIATTDCELWKIDQKTFRYLMMHSTETSDKQVVDMLKTVPLFSGLSSNFFLNLADAMTGKSYKDGELIIRKGDVGHTFYVIREGKVAVTEVGRRMSLRGSGPEQGWAGRVILGNGQTFGERALLTGETRSATVVASGDCHLLCLERNDFERILGPLNDLLEQARWRHILNRIPKFSIVGGGQKTIEISSDILKELTTSMMDERFEEKQIITRKGESGDKIYLIKEGQVQLSSCNEDEVEDAPPDFILTEGEVFGEHALFTGEANRFTVVAGTACVLASLDRNSAEHILTPILDVLERARWKTVLKNIPQLLESEFDTRDEEFMYSQISKQSFKNGQTVKELNESNSRSIYILNHGKVKVNRDQSIFTLSSGSYFGDSAFDEKSEGEIITFLEDSICGVVPYSTVKSCLGKVEKRPVTMAIRRFQSIPQPDVNVVDIRKHKLLGRGSFGKVWLVSKEGDDELYALKVMIKNRIHKKGQSHFVSNERRIMGKLKHPFLTKLYSAFQDDYSLYMLIDLIEGCEVYEYLQSIEKRRLSHDTARFFSACMVDALAYVHSKSIIHRDIKAENIMITKSGYTKIIDFGFAKVIENKTFTLCGTPYYLAPEMLLSKGYNKGADYWAFGVLLYEMLVGKVPFFATDEMSVYRLICSLKFNIPNYIRPDVADLLCRIFVKPKKRIGCLLAGSNDILDHEFYSSIDWDELRFMNVEPPELSISFPNFDHYKTRKGSAMSYEEADIAKINVNPEVEALFTEFGMRMPAIIEERPKPKRETPPPSKPQTPEKVKYSEPSSGGCCIIS